MLKRFTAMSVCLLLFAGCFAQPKDTSAIAGPATLPNEWMIKFAPLSIGEADGGLSFSIERLIARQRIGYQLEVQPIFLNIFKEGGNSGLDKPLDVLESGPIHGFKIRPEIRYYTSGLNTNHPISGSHSDWRFYLAADILYKQVWQRRVNEFTIGSGSLQPDVHRPTTYTDVKRIIGFECKYGLVKPIGNEHWLADIYFGLGIRFQKLFYKNIPPGAQEPDRNYFFGRSSGTRSETTPSVPMGLRIIYRW